MANSKSHVFVVNKFIHSQSAKDASELIGYYKNPNVDLEEIAYLALKLASSGTVLDFQNDENIADIASTGSPTSLSTLLCPLYLVQNGFKVLSLGVPGRPAGGIDVLAQIPGYQIELSKDKIEQCLQESGYAHFLANKDFAPADALLFQFRQQMNAQTVPNLVVASILSKKIAVGVRFLGLDVRISPHGNFGKTWKEGIENSRLFCAVSKILGINAKCFLTDARFPYQPYVGRGESLIALNELFNKTNENILIRHKELCSDIANALSTPDRHHFKKRIIEIFEENLIAQGTNFALFQEKSESIKESHATNFYIAEESGVLHIDLAKLRNILVNLQQEFTTKGLRFSDPAGIIFKKTTGEVVEEGEILATIRGEKDALNILRGRVPSVLTFDEKIPIKRKMEIIDNA
ncbi:MAG: hypothetical protein KIS76_07975 [Pyrinomonadaceae bacterium]|nr:hypothetical protein [Pyrinomonadaceae bacterium]